MLKSGKTLLSEKQIEAQLDISLQQILRYRAQRKSVWEECLMVWSIKDYFSVVTQSNTLLSTYYHHEVLTDGKATITIRTRTIITISHQVLQCNYGWGIRFLVIFEQIHCLEAQ